MIKVAIIGLGIMGRRMLKHMRIHEKFEPNFLWDPDNSACLKALKVDTEAKITGSPQGFLLGALPVNLAGRLQSKIHIVHQSCVDMCA